MHLKVVHRADRGLDRGLDAVQLKLYLADRADRGLDRGLDPRATQNFIFSGKVYFNFCAARIPNQGIFNEAISKNLEQATNQGKQAANQGISEQIQALQAKHGIFTGIYLQTQ